MKRKHTTAYLNRHAQPQPQPQPQHSELYNRAFLRWNMRLASGIYLTKLGASK